MDEFCNSLDAFSFEHLDRKNIASMCFGAGAGPGGGGGGEEGGDEGDIGPGADVGGAGGVGTGPGGGQGAGGGFAGFSGSVGPASWAPAFFAAPNVHTPNAPMTGVGFTGPAPTSTMTSVAGFLSDLLSPVPDVTKSITGFNKGTLADAIAAANPPSDPNPLGIIGDDDPEGGSDYLYEPILQAPQAAPTLLNPVPVAMRPQYEFKRNWWEGNKFVPAPITRIT